MAIIKTLFLILQTYCLIKEIKYAKEKNTEYVSIYSNLVILIMCIIVLIGR